MAKIRSFELRKANDNWLQRAEIDFPKCLENLKSEAESGNDFVQTAISKI